MAATTYIHMTPKARRCLPTDLRVDARSVGELPTSHRQFRATSLRVDGGQPATRNLRRDTSMTDSSRHSTLRLISKLEHALGPDLCRVIDEPDVIEVMLNPDGKLFIERLGGSINTLGNMAASAAETVIGCVAHVLGV